MLEGLAHPAEVVRHGEQDQRVQHHLVRDNLGHHHPGKDSALSETKGTFRNWELRNGTVTWQLVMLFFSSHNSTLVRHPA